MPSDANGVYTLPQGYLAVTGDTILASQHNPPLEDLAAAMSGRLMATGANPMTGPLKLADGSAAAPSATFGSATNVGLFRTPSGIGVSINGAQVFEFTTISPTVPVGFLGDWPVQTPPSGWLLCDGRSLLRATYPALAAVLIGVYGGADGAHFYLPDLRGAVTAGWDSTGSRGIFAGAISFSSLQGVESAPLSVAQLPAYTLPNTLGVTRTGSVALSAAATGVVNSTSGGGANMTGGGGALKQDNITVTDTQAWSISGSITSGGSNGVVSRIQPTMIVSKIIFAGA